MSTLRRRSLAAWLACGLLPLMGAGAEDSPGAAESLLKSKGLLPVGKRLVLVEQEKKVVEQREAAQRAVDAASAAGDRSSLLESAETQILGGEAEVGELNAIIAEMDTNIARMYGPGRRNNEERAYVMRREELGVRREFVNRTLGTLKSNRTPPRERARVLSDAVLTQEEAKEEIERLRKMYADLQASYAALKEDKSVSDAVEIVERARKTDYTIRASPEAEKVGPWLKAMGVKLTGVKPPNPKPRPRVATPPIKIDSLESAKKSLEGLEFWKDNPDFVRIDENRRRVIILIGRAIDGASYGDAEAALAATEGAIAINQDYGGEMGGDKKAVVDNAGSDLARARDRLQAIVAAGKPTSAPKAVPDGQKRPRR